MEFSEEVRDSFVVPFIMTLLDSTELKLQLAHAFGVDGAKASETFRPRGTVEIWSFQGPVFTTRQPDLTSKDLELLKVVDYDLFY